MLTSSRRSNELRLRTLALAREVAGASRIGASRIGASRIGASRIGRERVIRGRVLARASNSGNRADEGD
jgi:hypothetical protein